MGDIIKWPNERLVKDGLANPRFVSDIQNEDQNLIETIIHLLNLPATGADSFAIISGFDYDSNEGTYTSGICYIDGTLYLCESGLIENKYLVPDIQNEQNKIFSDDNIYPTYKVYYAVQNDTQENDCPQFVGNMDYWRINLSKLRDKTQKCSNRYTLIMTLSDDGSDVYTIDKFCSSAVITLTQTSSGPPTKIYTVRINLTDDITNLIVMLSLIPPAEYGTIDFYIYSSNTKLLYNKLYNGDSGTFTENFKLEKIDFDNDNWVKTNAITVL